MIHHIFIFASSFIINHKYRNPLNSQNLKDFLLLSFHHKYTETRKSLIWSQNLSCSHLTKVLQSSMELQRDLAQANDRSLVVNAENQTDKVPNAFFWGGWGKKFTVKSPGISHFVAVTKCLKTPGPGSLCCRRVSCAFPETNR